MKKAIVLTILSLLFLNTPTNAQVYLNEWMSSNSSTIADPDFNESGDWIELFNEYNDTLDLSGYFLSDNLLNPLKWRIPQNTKIAPNEFLLIWADGNDIGLHTNFKLGSTGEEIGLFNPDTLLLDSVVFGQQDTDISMGRRTDGSMDLAFFPNPTPGKSNTTESFEGMTHTLPHFSVRGGFFESSFDVNLWALEGTIRYTLDGSLPTLNSEEYTSPIQISQTTNLRARVFQPNFIPSKPVTHTYFFNENFAARGLPVVSISTNPAYFWDADIGLYVQDFKPDWEYPINIELFENDGGNRAAFNEMAGTKVNGQNSWELPQKMLGIYFDNEYDKNNLNYPLFFDRNRTRFDNFILRASGSDWSSTLFRDGLCQELTRANMDIEITGFRPSIVYVNGEYTGISNLRSRVDESFIEDNFGYTSDEYDLIENDGEVENGDAAAFGQLFALFDEDLTNPTNYNKVDSLMDIRNFTDYFITEIWSSNGSWGHNIQMWKPKNEGKWRFILQDLDRGFSTSDNDGIDEFTTVNSPQNYNWARTSLRSMLENEDFSAQFSQRFADHLYTTFHPQRVTTEILKKKAAIQAEIPNHVDRWAGTMSNYGDGIPSVDFWEGEVSELITFAKERQVFMIEDLRDHFPLEETSNLGLMVFPTDAGEVKINEIMIPETPWSGPYFKGLPFEFSAEARAGHQFEGWSIATFETLIEKESEWKYLDDGSNQDTEWQDLNFSDSSWATGQAELGYGDGDENTEISFGNDGNNKYATTYFRKVFEIQNLAEYSGEISINLKRDDGAIVYLNGIELFRTNMPNGTIDFETYASDFVGGAAEDAFINYILQTNQFLEGENVIAVEIHQATASSSDLSFDLELKALKVGQTDLISTSKILEINLSSDSVFIANFAPTGECILPRIIDQNTTLTIDCSPYLAPYDVTVLNSVKLTVEADVEIHFSENKNLRIHGDLQINGTTNLPVRLLPNADENVEQWGALIFENTTDTSYLNHVHIVGASKGLHPINEKAAISAFRANLELNQVYLTEVFADPIFTQYSYISLTNSQLHSKVTGDLINVKYGTGIIDNVDFRGNNQPDTDAIDYDEVKNSVIRNSKIYDFFGFNSDGIDLGEESEDVLIENNFIHNCTDKGISVGQSSTIFAQNNTIVNCNQGFGIKDLGTAEIDQNSFYNVATPIAVFEKNIGAGGGMAFVSNSILSNSPNQPFFVDSKSVLDISNSLSDTDTISGFDNLFDHPRFDNPTQNIFELMSNSPCLDAGIDDLGNVIDLGTKNHTFSARADVQFSAINYHPFPNPEMEFITIYNPSSEIIDLTNYVLSEGIQFTFPNTQIAPDETIWVVKNLNLFFDVTEQIFEWTSGKLSNNGEAIRLTDSHGIIIDQVIYSDAFPWPTEADGLGGWLTLISPDLDNHFAESWQLEGFTDTEDLVFNETGLLVYPNPASDFVTVYQKEGKAIEQISIYDEMGRLVLEKDLEENSIDVSEFTSGFYFVKTESGFGKLAVH